MKSVTEIDSRLNRDIKFINRNDVIDNPPKVVNFSTIKIKRRFSFILALKKLGNFLDKWVFYPWYRRLFGFHNF